MCVPVSRVARVLLLIGASLLALGAPIGVRAEGLAAPDLTPPLPAGLAYVTGSALSTPKVWAARPGGREAKRLGAGQEPLLAPSGRAVAVTAFSPGLQEQGPAVVIYSTVGGTPSSYLSLATATAQPLAWSPDSRYLAVALQSTSPSGEAGSGLAVIDTDTGVVATIASGAVHGASFAPDGSDRIVYALARSLALAAPVNLYIAQPDGSGTRALTSDGRSLYPLWGPRYIAYDRERRRSEAPEYQIWLIAPSGGGTRRLTHVGVDPLVWGLVPLAFSGSGGRLLAEFGGQDTSEAWTVLVASGRARRILVRGQPVMAAGISRDGRTLLIDEGALGDPPSDGRIASIPFSGGAAKLLIGHGSQASWNG